MLNGRLFWRLPASLSDFGRSDKGNVMITFALALIPLLGLVGAAVDYTRGNSAKVAMQAANDATALMLSKDAQKLNSTQLQDKAVKAFTALLHRPDVTNLVVTPTYTEGGNSNFRLTVVATARVPTTFTRILGRDYMNLSTTSEVVWGIRRLELALALDVTGSMAQRNKMEELKKAAKSLLTTLKGAARRDGDIRVAIVPFAVNVNVGTSYVNASWLDWSDWSSPPAIMNSWLASARNQNVWDRTGPGRPCPLTRDSHGLVSNNENGDNTKYGCTNGPASKQNDTTISTIPSSGTYAGMICPSRADGSKSTTATGVLTGRYYNGCYTSVVKPNADWHPVATGPNASCGNLTSSQCQCSGRSDSKVCAMIPSSNWKPLAQGSDKASCGKLPSDACECFGNDGNKVCKQKTYFHEWRPNPKTAANIGWNGCVRDRNQDYDVQNTAPSFVSMSDQKTNISGQLENYPRAAAPDTSDAFQPWQQRDCPAALLPLTYDWNALNSKVDALQPVGNTNVTIGLTWAFHALTPSAPLSTALPPADDLDRVIILLTDGDNTQNRWSDSTDSSDIDDRTKKACSNVKAAGIRLYTIRVIDGNASLLQQCASKSDMYYNVQSASTLNDVFESIAQELANLRIAK
jgi:Flp pilus assembly protein TadG